MRVKKYGFIISFCITLTFGWIYAAYQFNWFGISKQFTSSVEEFIKVIASGGFASAMVTMIIYGVEYNIEKKLALRELNKSIVSFLNSIYKIEYLELKEPYELVTGCLRERADNRGIEASNENLFKLVNPNENEEKRNIYAKYYKSIKSDARKSMINYLEENIDKNTKSILGQPFELKKYLDEKYENLMQEYENSIEQIMKHYLELSDDFFQEIEDSYGEIDFLFSFLSRLHPDGKINEVNRIYESAYQLCFQIVDSKVDFRLHMVEGLKNIVVMLDKIRKLQDILYETEQTEVGYIVYKELYYQEKCRLNKVLKYKKDNDKEMFILFSSYGKIGKM